MPPDVSLGSLQFKNLVFTESEWREWKKLDKEVSRMWRNFWVKILKSKGFSNVVIAKELGIPESTVRNILKPSLKIFKDSSGRKYVQVTRNRLEFSSREDAKKILEALREVLNKFDSVTVSDLKELSGIPYEYLDTKRGWKSLEKVPIRKTPTGYILDLPVPKDFIYNEGKEK